MGGGSDGNQLVRRVDARPAQRADHVREQRGVDLRACPARRTSLPVSRHQDLDRARHLVARRELVDEALAAGVQEQRALAADRLGDRGTRRRRGRRDGGRVELDELEIGERGTGRVREQQAAAGGAGRIGGACPQRGGAAGASTAAAAATRRPSWRGSRRSDRRATITPTARGLRGTSIDGFSATERGELTGDTTAGGRCRRRGLRGGAECPPSSPSASRPRRSASNRTPSAARSRTIPGASLQRTRAADSAHGLGRR